jgi:hypothetical protein
VRLPKVVKSVDALSVADGGVWLLAGDDNGWTMALQRTGRRWQFRRAGLPRLYANDPGNGTGVDIAMISRRDGWIVGSGVLVRGTDGSFVTRWNGRTWNTIHVPSVMRGGPSAHGGEQVLGVAAANTSNVWTIGDAVSVGFVGWYTLHWDGRRWHAARNPGGVRWSRGGGFEMTIDVTREGEAWLVGGDDTAVHKKRGGGWYAVPDPARNVDLSDVSASSPGSAWAVGARVSSDYKGVAVVEHIVCPA